MDTRKNRIKKDENNRLMPIIRIPADDKEKKFKHLRSERMGKK